MLLYLPAPLHSNLSKVSSSFKVFYVTISKYNRSNLKTQIQNKDAWYNHWVTFLLHTLYDVSSFNMSLWHHLVPAECQLTYFLTKRVLKTILRWYQNTCVQLCMAFHLARLQWKGVYFLCLLNSLSLLPRASSFFKKFYFRWRWVFVAAEPLPLKRAGGSRTRNN